MCDTFRILFNATPTLLLKRGTKVHKILPKSQSENSESLFDVKWALYGHLLKPQVMIILYIESQMCSRIMDILKPIAGLPKGRNSTQLDN